MYYLFSLLNSLSIIILCFALISHVKHSSKMKKFEISSNEVIVLIVKNGFDAYSMRIFTSSRCLDLFMKNHPLPDGFHYEYETVICNPCD